MIAELSKQFFESALVDGGLEYTDDKGNPGNLKIAQICIGGIDDTNIDENEGQYVFPIVVFDEGNSNPKLPLHNLTNPLESPLYETNVTILVYAKSSEEAASLCFAVQSIVVKGFYEQSLNSSITRIDAVSRGIKRPVEPVSYRNAKDLWLAVRSITVTNRLEP